MERLFKERLMGFHSEATWKMEQKESLKQKGLTPKETDRSEGGRA